jgi:hypothetical protein
VTLASHEAVAIAQQLIHDRCSRVAEPPFGLPSPETVSIDVDGGVVCRGCEVTPTAPEIAIFLHAALAHTPRVPGGLRYAIARALHDVDAPPFDSLADFSAALGRYERGRRRDVLRALAGRVDWDCAGATLVRMPVDRRRAVPSTTELRRLLREADRQLFERRMVALPPSPTRRSMRARLRIVGVAILCLLTIGGASLSRTHEDCGPAAATPALRSAEHELAEATARPMPVRLVVPETIAPQAKHSVTAPRSRDSGPRATPPASPRDRRLRAPGESSHRVVAKLRLPWMHRAIVVRDDL